MRHESLLYYMKHYLYINRLQERAAWIWFGGIFAEIWLTDTGMKAFGAVQRVMKALGK